jgi:hypothetical protein
MIIYDNQSDQSVHFFHSFHHIRVVIIVPLSHINPLLHFFKSILEHFGKL